MPFVVAEQFATLEALHPHRIDLGIGRAPGTDQATAAALRGVSPYLTVEQFPEHLQTLLGLLGDERIDPELVARLHATPAPTTYPEVWMLGSSTYGAQVAAALGLPFCYAYHFAMSSDVENALHLYRTGFKPSPQHPMPHVMVSASVIAAETTEEPAHRQARPDRLPFASGRGAAQRSRPEPARLAARHPVRGDGRRGRGGSRRARVAHRGRRGHSRRHGLRPGHPAGHAGSSGQGVGPLMECEAFVEREG
jgi:luciferase family oxidoreductase group 1